MSKITIKKIKNNRFAINFGKNVRFLCGKSAEEIKNYLVNVCGHNADNIEII